MLNQEIIIKRLSLIKYLYRIGIDQSHQFETLASFAILSFHDSIEMFLNLVAEKENVKTDKFALMEYWSKFPKLTLKESINNLNVRRKNIKHKGLLPSKSDIEISRVNTTDFFEQNTPTFFDIEFKDISLLSLVSNKAIRNELEKSQTALEMGKFAESIESSAVAFTHLLYRYEENKYTFSSNSPFLFGNNMNRYDWHGYTKLDDKLDNFIQDTAKSMLAMQKAMKIISLGIDYKRYMKFNLLTPNVNRMMNGGYITQIWREKQWSKENCQYCIDFVLDACLKLQEFDFDIRTIENEELLEHFNEKLDQLDKEDEIVILSPSDLIVK